MRAVNLLPKEATRTAGRRPALPVVVAAAAPLVAGSLVFAGYRLEHAGVTTARGKLDAVQAQIAALPKKDDTHSALDALALERGMRVTALAAVLADRIPWDRTFVDLARVLPSDVWLTSLNLSSPTPADSVTAAAATPQAAVANPNAFSISGYTYSQASVARLLTRLRLLPMLSGVTLGSTTSSTVGSKAVVQFSVTAAITPPLPEAAT